MPVLHLLVLGLLVLGMLMKPVLAVACDIGDARQALASEQHLATPSPDSGTGDDCCPAQNCNECCTGGAVLVPPASTAVTDKVNSGPLPRLSVQFEPPAYPVGFRPPIAG